MLSVPNGLHPPYNLVPNLKTPTNMTNEEIIDAIVTYQTLPSQIDYQRPWALKAREAEQYIDNHLTPEQAKEVNAEIAKQIEEYYAEIPGMDGHSPASLAELF
jgi:hypothetical protein